FIFLCLPFFHILGIILLVFKIRNFTVISCHSNHRISFVYLLMGIGVYRHPHGRIFWNTFLTHFATSVIGFTIKYYFKLLFADIGIVDHADFIRWNQFTYLGSMSVAFRSCLRMLLL